MSVQLPAGLGPWTIEDLYAMPETTSRVELVDGSLVVTPAPAPVHQYALSRLTMILTEQLREDYVVVENLGVVIGSSLRIPDLLVFRTEKFDVSRVTVDPATLSLVVEVVSPSSRSQDRLVKPQQYAAAGIGAYWRIETEDELALTAHTLRHGVYAELGRWCAGETATILDPFAVSIRIDRLVPPG